MQKTSIVFLNIQGIKSINVELNKKYKGMLIMEPFTNYNIILFEHNNNVCKNKNNRFLRRLQIGFGTYIMIKFGYNLLSQDIT